jgi:hypothetical protein
MPANKKARPLPSPWKEFLGELDRILREPLELHCIGGFVFTHFYGLPRTTGDIDYCTAIPANPNLDEVAGQGSPLHTKQGVWLHHMAVANLPEDYASRLADMAPGTFRSLRLLVPDPYDCILSKLERNAAKDRDDADYLFRSQNLNALLLRDRYKNELRHNLIGNVEWHDKTLELWIDIFETQT